MLSSLRIPYSISSRSIKKMVIYEMTWTKGLIRMNLSNLTEMILNNHAMFVVVSILGKKKCSLAIVKI